MSTIYFAVPRLAAQEERRQTCVEAKPCRDSFCAAARNRSRDSASGAGSRQTPAVAHQVLAGGQPGDRNLSSVPSLICPPSLRRLLCLARPRPPDLGRGEHIMYPLRLHHRSITYPSRIKCTEPLSFCSERSH